MTSLICFTRCQKMPQIKLVLLFIRGQMMYGRLAPRTCWINIENLFNNTRQNLLRSQSQVSSADRVFYSKVFILSNRLESFCKENGIEFVNMWSDFYNKTGLFKEDGLRLSSVGAARFRRVLSEAVGKFWVKNGGSSQGIRPAQ